MIGYHLTLYCFYETIANQMLRIAIYHYIYSEPKNNYIILIRIWTDSDIFDLSEDVRLSSTLLVRPVSLYLYLVYALDINMFYIRQNTVS